MIMLTKYGQEELDVFKLKKFMVNGCIYCKNVESHSPYYVSATMVSESPDIPNINIQIPHNLVASVLTTHATSKLIGFLRGTENHP